MKLQQLRYIWEVAHHDLNVSATAQSLFTSQPGISKQIRLLEDELGVEVFARSGKHLTHITPAGEVILDLAGEILRKADSIKKVAQEFSDETAGTLSIATTHTQARYVLPSVITAFMAQYPDVSLAMKQGTPPQVAQMAADGEVDFVIATEALNQFSSLITLPCYRWNRCVVVPQGHPLTSLDHCSLEAIAEHPIVTYTTGFTGRSKLDEAFNDLPTNYCVLAHNTIFDGSIFRWKYRKEPKFWLDTMSMARPKHNLTTGCSLSALSKYYKLGTKGTEVLHSIGKRKADFTPQELKAYAEYCINDVEVFSYYV